MGLGFRVFRGLGFRVWGFGQRFSLFACGFPVFRNYSRFISQVLFLWCLALLIMHSLLIYRPRKCWQMMFKDEKDAKRNCETEGFNCTWDASNRLTLRNRQPFVRKNALSGRAIWYNHINVLHGQMMTLAPILRSRAVSRRGVGYRVEDTKPTLTTVGAV